MSENQSGSTKKWLLGPIILLWFLITLLIGAALIDQAIYPKNEVESKFTDQGNADLTINMKGALLFDAAYNQMSRELNSSLGWCPNDILINPFSWLDNRCNRQVGVWYATGKAITILSERITKLGMGDEENSYTRKARLHLGNFPDQWGWMGALEDASENHFGQAGKNIASFRQDMEKADPKDKLINLRSDDLVAIFDSIVGNGGILSEPFGKLTSRGADLPWSYLDDTVYYAQGAALVARDILVTLKSSFPTELERGGMRHLDVAIESLNAAGVFNPYMITRGDGDSMFADHRSKMQRYYTDAFRRLTELRDSLKT